MLVRKWQLFNKAFRGLHEMTSPQHEITMRILILTIILLISTQSPIAFADAPKNQCAPFDSIALQLALAQNKMPPPLNLEQIQLLLGAGNSETSLTLTTYSWIYKNRILLVKTNGDDIADKMLTGSNDGSITSKKMEQIYEKLKSATSVWIIKDIQRQLGPGHITSNKLRRYSWYCGSGSLTITIDQNNNVTATTISYQAPLGSIETRIGPIHPEWDIKTDSLGESHRAWQRTFEG